MILPNYNHEAFIVERITSILRQTVLPDEIIFLDDCSTDDTWRMLNELFGGRQATLAIIHWNIYVAALEAPVDAQVLGCKQWC